MITERRRTIRAPQTKIIRPPFMQILLTPWLCFALVTVGGKVKAVPGASLASAEMNGLAYLQGKK